MLHWTMWAHTYSIPRVIVSLTITRHFLPYMIIERAVVCVCGQVCCTIMKVFMGKLLVAHEVGVTVFFWRKLPLPTQQHILII